MPSANYVGLNISCLSQAKCWCHWLEHYPKPHFGTSLSATNRSWRLESTFPYCRLKTHNALHLEASKPSISVFGTQVVETAATVASIPSFDCQLALDCNSALSSVNHSTGDILDALSFHWQHRSPIVPKDPHNSPAEVAFSE